MTSLSMYLAGLDRVLCDTFAGTISEDQETMLWLAKHCMDRSFAHLQVLLCFNNILKKHQKSMTSLTKFCIIL